MSVTAHSGGMFNCYKIKYSPETHQLLKVLMDEVKLTTAQRQQMKECLKKGEPLPMINKKCHRPSYVDENLFDLKKNFYFQKRGRDQIIHSGAYERERYKYLGRTVDLEKEKEKLQSIMVYGKNSKNRAVETCNGKQMKTAKPKVISSEERIEELVIEIEERIDFLREMESMGKAKDYENIIKQEIARKYHELKKLDNNTAQKYVNFLYPAKKIEEKGRQNLGLKI